MMEMRQCQGCGVFWLYKKDGKEHRCPPKWEIICDDHDPEKTWVQYGEDANAALERWAYEFDCQSGGPPEIANGMGDNAVYVRARRQGDTSWRRFVVTGEWEPTYYPEEL